MRRFLLLTALLLSAVVGAQESTVPAGAASSADADADIRRIKKELAADDQQELREFEPTEPLPADVGVDLPSDM